MKLRTVILALCFCVSTIMSAQAGDATEAYQTCATKGWKLEKSTVLGYPREWFWKGPQGPWTNGAIIVMHGGGGTHYQFCASTSKLTDAQQHFVDLAVQQGFGVFILNSTDQMTDAAGKVCGKAWDDEVHDRPNIDLPFIREAITQYIPERRTAGSSPSVFLTGLSSGGYMSTRAATELGSNLVTAFAPISSGDPYGWHRDCTPKLLGRKLVHGEGMDNDTGKVITETGSCISESGYANEMPWPSTSKKPVFKLFHHRKDGVHDFSCNERLHTQLLAHGYPEDGRLILEEDGWRKRRLALHFWLDDYNQPILDFFKKHSIHLTKN